MDSWKKEQALAYHAEKRPGKIEIKPTKNTEGPEDLALAYSPGVAAPCIEIHKHPTAAYRYTAKGNLVAVISNGTAVLGLGNIGALAAKPVMEGKGVLFKKFADIDVFDLEIAETDPKKLIQIIRSLEPTFGGINLEDIKAPECFEIERELRDLMQIPVMHDDQHGTAIVSAAALTNALKLQQKDIAQARIVINGAGAAAIACAHLYLKLGAQMNNIIFFDSKGCISEDRVDINEIKLPFARGKKAQTLYEALSGADVFLGVSKANILTDDMVLAMAERPIVFALANPDPEITYDKAVHLRADLIIATGRSDYPNQVNNVLGFPYIFRGALDVGATKITKEMELAAVRALAHLATLPITPAVQAMYPDRELTFGCQYILPTPFDERLLAAVAFEVAQAAVQGGIARVPVTDWEAYRTALRNRRTF